MLKCYWHFFFFPSEILNTIAYEPLQRQLTLPDRDISCCGTLKFRGSAVFMFSQAGKGILQVEIASLQTAMQTSCFVPETSAYI